MIDRQSAFQGTRLLLLAALAASLLGCGNQQVRVSGEPPLLRLDGLTRDAGDLILEISIRNVNDAALETPRMHYRLEFDGVLAAEVEDGHPRMNIPPRGREITRVRVSATEAALGSLDELARGERSNLPWRLQVSFAELGRRQQPEETQGFLHPMPGQPHRFR